MSTANIKGPKVYELYPYRGGYTVMSRHYHGTMVYVLASSAKQALSLAGRGAWINPRAATLSGIVLIYTRDDGRRLWCGCAGHHIEDMLQNGSSLQAVRELIRLHRCGAVR